MHLGLAFATLSAVFNGSFGSLAKLPPVRKVSPIVFNYWMCEGAALAGVLALAAEPRVFTPLGLASGALFVVAAASTFAAISYLGLAVASGVWCGTAVLVSFAYGVLVAGDAISQPQLAAAALALLLLGIAGMAVAGQLGGHSGEWEESERLAQSAAEGLREPLVAAVEDGEAGQPPQQLQRGYAAFELGCVAAVAAGSFGGLVLAPMVAAPPSARGLPFVPSMAAGIFVAGPLVTLLLSCLAGPDADADPLRSPAAAAWAGLAAGAVWQAGNVCSILAVQDPRVGLAVAYPLMQCGLFVAGAWGILLFREVRGRAAALYWAAGGVLIAGAALLAASK